MGTTERPLDALALRDWAHTGVSDLITHLDEINRLNVFPVADSDTGANMLFTMRSALAQVDSTGGAGPEHPEDPEHRDVAQVAAALAAGALNGARGNSGVILSQILRGVSDVTDSAAAGQPLAAIDAALLAAALWRGVELVITSMGGEEVPGTIVSVLRAAAVAVRQCADAGEGLAAAVAAAGDAAVVALEKTPEQLDVLADAGVVDAGGRGLLVLLDALRSTITGQTPARSVYEPAPRSPALGAGVPAPVPQFEVMYLLAGCDAAAADTLRDRLSELGDSVAIAAAPSESYSVHVHTDDAGAAVEAGLAAGRLSKIVISALSSGTTALAAGGWTRQRAVLAIVDGDGAAELFAAEGACVLRPGAGAAAPASDLSAHQLVRAVVDTGAAQVMVLPNGYVAVEELVAGCTAAIGWGVDVVPVPTGSMVQGLAALAVHDPASQAVDDGYIMARAAGAARHGSVRIATETALTWAGTCKPGDGLGIAGDEVLIVADDVAAAAIGLVDLLLAPGGDLVTVLLGAGIDDDERIARLVESLEKHMHDHHPGTELVIYRTGHRGDALLIGVE
ncbi:DAK2 domain-containing protein [Mycobacterium marinum]|uniref:DAK2 domain-containing protein n=1 Tax=Mycobacterium marinum TaxID=1781 RepID=UPI0023591328|nr:DAK2 domain-containing protein [Mycobacterium marinum]MDC8972824.1 DAK2 domain-containing protein [Mycobacterium marinum]